MIASEVFLTNLAARVRLPASTASVMPGKVVAAYPVSRLARGGVRAGAYLYRGTLGENEPVSRPGAKMRCR